MMTLDELTTALAARANDYERAVQWPVQSLADFASAGGGGGPFRNPTVAMGIRSRND